MLSAEFLHPAEAGGLTRKFGWLLLALYVKLLSLSRGIVVISRKPTRMLRNQPRCLVKDDELTMNNFGRVLKIAAQRRFALVGILASSLVIAVLWGANIGTLYPLVEVVFKGDSLPSYVASRIEASQVDLTEIDQQLDELSGSIALADDGDKLALQVELQALESRRALVSETHAPSSASAIW